MVCPNCGSAIEPSDRECPNCGASLERSTDPRQLEKKSQGLKQMTRELKAVDSGGPQRFESGDGIAGRFRVDEFIARGPLGEVYRARDDESEAVVAVKLFDPELIETAEEQSRFERVARRMKSMTQANVVRLYDSGIDDTGAESLPWVSMEYLQGLTLRKALQLRDKKGQRFEVEELESIVRQIVRALQHLGRAFPHGNLKPSNVFILPDRVAVTDGFELSAFAPDTWVERLNDSVFLAPELRAEGGELTKRADVFSLGTIIRRMRFGEEGDSATLSTDIDEGIDRLCRRATASTPADRYPSPEALCEDLLTLIDTGQLLDDGAEETRIEVDPTLDSTTEETVRDPNVPPVVSGTSTVAEGATAAASESDRETPTAESPPDESADGSTAKPAGAAGGGQSDEPAPHWVIGGIMIVLVIVAIAVANLDFGSDEPVEITPSDDVDVGESARSSDAGESETMQFEEGSLEGAVAAADVGRTPDAATTRDAAVDVARADAAATGADEADDPTPGSGSGPPSTLGDKEPGGAAGGGAGGEKTPRGTDCPSGMALVKAGSGNYCIDRYEYPGQGQTPKVNVTWFAAQKLCEERQARLCTLNEFQRACGRTYPWGDNWDPDRCNTADADGFARQVEPTGSHDRCRSWPGTYDMVGNVAEWVKEQRIVGGGYDSGPQVATCRYVSKKAPGRGAPNVGFRCCAAPD